MDDLMAGAITCTILFLIHLFICGLFSLVTMMICERAWRIKLKFATILIWTMWPGMVSFGVYAWIIGDESTFLLPYVITTILGLIIGVRVARRMATTSQDGTQGQ